jgi:hypothetical protein
MTAADATSDGVRSEATVDVALHRRSLRVLMASQLLGGAGPAAGHQGV